MPRDLASPEFLSSVEEMIKRSKLAKRRLERTDDSVDEISWQVGYEDAAFFRRLFKRTTGLAPEPTGNAFAFLNSPACSRGVGWTPCTA